MLRILQFARTLGKGPGPLRTVRATRRGTRLKQAARALQVEAAGFLLLAGLEPALAGCVHEAGLVIVRLGRVSRGGEIAGGYRLAGDVQPPPFPLLGGLGWLVGVSRWSPQSGQSPSCLVSRRRLYLSSGGLTFLRRAAQ